MITMIITIIVTITSTIIIIIMFILLVISIIIINCPGGPSSLAPPRRQQAGSVRVTSVIDPSRDGVFRDEPEPKKASQRLGRRLRSSLGGFPSFLALRLEPLQMDERGAGVHAHASFRIYEGCESFADVRGIFTHQLRD